MGENRQATRKDVAQKAGVSVATVSYVLNHTKSFSPEVESRVRRAAEELRYRPNLVARSLITKHSSHVAILVDNLKNPYYLRILEGAQKVASEKGYIVTLLLSDYLDGKLTDQILARQFDGMIFTTQDCRMLYQKMSASIPCMLGDYVHIEYGNAIREAVRKLKQSGHQHIAMLCGLSEGTTDSRIWDFREALKEQKIEIDEDLFVWSKKEKTTEEQGYLDMEELLSRRKAFTGVFALNDLMAIGAIRCLKHHGIRVPEDVSIFGCDNDDRDQDMAPPLASIDVSANLLGEELMRALLSLIEHVPYKKVIIRGKFIPRQSIAKCNEAQDK